MMAWKLAVTLILVMLLRMEDFVHGGSQVPCYFIFGDSLADNGNNNLLATQAIANYPPYGVDFPGGTATGRFSNGLTYVDLIGQLLGFENLIPSYASSATSGVDKGVNYASASSGIRAESGQALGVHVSFDSQLNNHGVVVARITSEMGDGAAGHLNSCLYTVGLGSNDYINNYFKPEYGTSSSYNPDQYAKALVDQYSQQIRRLYDYGARKIALFGVGGIGCTPDALQSHGLTSGCVDEMNSAVFLFDAKLKSLVDQLNNDLSGAKVTLINVAGINSGDPRAAGFTDWTHGCCKTNEVGQCVPSEAPCPNRNQFAFWDHFHPTEAVNKFLAQRSYKAADPSDAYPCDISKLLA